MYAVGGGGVGGKEAVYYAMLRYVTLCQTEQWCALHV